MRSLSNCDDAGGRKLGFVQPADAGMHLGQLQTGAAGRRRGAVGVQRERVADRLHQHRPDDMPARSLPVTPLARGDIL